MRQLCTLRMIKSIFNDPESGKLIVGFKLVKPISMVASLFLYVVYGAGESEEDVEKMVNGEK